MFSELSLFLFGSGLALFIALLGWSDQIRSTTRETRDLEKRFLEQHGIHVSELAPVIRPKNPNEQLEALTKLITRDKIKTRSAAQALPLFQQWNEKLTTLEKYYSIKYDLTIVLTICLFVAGIVSLLITPWSRLVIFGYSLHPEIAVLLIPMSVLVVIMAIIIIADFKEKAFHRLLQSLLDKV